MGIANYGHVTTDFLDNAYQYFPDDLLPLIHGDFGGYGPIAAEPQDGTHGLEQEELSALADTVKDVHHYNGGKMDKLGAVSLQDGALDVTSSKIPALMHGEVDGSVHDLFVINQATIKDDESSSVLSDPYDTDTSDAGLDQHHICSSSPTTLYESSSLTPKKDEVHQPVPLIQTQKNNLVMIGTVSRRKRSCTTARKGADKSNKNRYVTHSKISGAHEEGTLIHIVRAL
jgi:hypothetical protein